MEKITHFLAHPRAGWPETGWLAPYFLTRHGRHRAFGDNNDSWGLGLEGIEGTEHLPPFNGRIDIHLTIIGHPDLGVLLCHQRFGAGRGTFYSKGDLKRLREWTRTMHGDLMPIGLFIPFEAAWSAVKEFIETEGALPEGISWVSGGDLPGDAFPDPLEGARIRD
jgi:Immunity protein Imm1